MNIDCRARTNRPSLIDTNSIDMHSNYAIEAHKQSRVNAQNSTVFNTLNEFLPKKLL